VVSLDFAGIGNIHVMRASLVDVGAAASTKAPGYHAKASAWLGHVATVLKGAASVADYLERGDSVLVHCSDGWDRT